jgi:hypothetical protein
VAVALENCNVKSNTIEITYKPGLPKPTLYAYGPNAWYFVCSIDYAQKYKWYYNGNWVAENDQYVYYAGADLGEYYVEVKDTGDCYVPSDKVVIPLVPTEVDKTTCGNELFVFPNPTSGNIRIFYSDIYTGKILIRIYNMEGVVSMEQEFFKNQIYFSEEIELSDFKPGIYILELNSDHIIMKTRFLVL